MTARSMLTRGQVAKRLGKSIATVRRLEGLALHPVVDENGVHWFDEAEVEGLAGRVRRPLTHSARGRSAWFDSRARSRMNPPDDGEDEDEERSDGTECSARKDTARELLDADLVRRERELSTHEGALAERERQVREREIGLTRKLEPTAAEALRDDPEFRASMQLQAAKLVDELSRLPRRLVRRVLTEDDLELLDAILTSID